MNPPIQEKTVFYDDNAILFDDPKHSMEEERFMEKEYDIEKLNPRKNPYSKRLKQQVTINIDRDTVDFFKRQSEEAGIPYQTLINLYLSDCAKQKKQLQMSWK